MEDFLTKEIILSQLPLLIDLTLAVLLGFCIGYERKLRFKEAGIRTHTIVCVGSALMTLISMYAFSEGDPGRIAAQIVTGIGFLGAGMIVYRRNEVRGLTTAAGVWATAGIGMACGARLYIVAIGATAIIIVAQCLFHLPLKIFHSTHYYSVKIEFIQTKDENLTIKRLFKTDRYNHLVIRRVDDKLIYSATLNTSMEYSSSKLNSIVAEHDFILSIERCDDE